MLNKHLQEEIRKGEKNQENGTPGLKEGLVPSSSQGLGTGPTPAPPVVKDVLEDGESPSDLLGAVDEYVL